MNLGRLIIPIIFLVIAAGAVIFRDRISGNAGELVVGDCFDVPTGETIKDVQHHPCADAHDGEILFVGNYPGSDTLPTETQFQSFVERQCIGQVFPDYIGATYDSREDLSVGAFWPTADGWKGGDRELTCYISPTDGQKVTVSYRAAAPAAS
ncbi:MAG: septum formation family protein [Candidatus Limnocylindrales bacterium]